MEQKHKIFNLIVLDESGSMQSIKASVISGFNELVQTVKGAEKQHPEQEHFISLTSFNGLGIKILLDKEKTGNLNELNVNNYRPDASTPLYDAMGQAINHLRKTTDSEAGYNVLVTIITDGEENASKEYKATAIKALVDELKAKNWTFTYIGANQNVERVAESLSIDNQLAFQSTMEETKEMFVKEKKARALFYHKVANKADVSKDYFAEDENNMKNK